MSAAHRPNSRPTARSARRPFAVGLAAAALLLTIAACRGADAEGTTSQEGRRGGAAAGAPREPDWAAVDAAMGRTGTMQPGNVRRYGMPRSDMRVTVQGVPIRPGFALGSWLAMTPHGDSAGRATVMAMGDMVLKETEVAPVMSALQAGGVEQTAIHHHVLYESPRVVYMHVHATGDPVRIAQTVRSALGHTSTPAAASPAPAAGVAHRSRWRSIRQPSLGRSGASARRTAASTRRACRAPRRSATRGWRSRRRWGSER